jgi:hypothetical protein
MPGILALCRPGGKRNATLQHSIFIVSSRSNSAPALDEPRQSRLRPHEPQALPRPRSKTRTGWNCNKEHEPRRPRRPGGDHNPEKPMKLWPTIPHPVSPGQEPRRMPRTRNRYLRDASRVQPRVLSPRAQRAQQAPEHSRRQAPGTRAEKANDVKARNSRHEAWKTGRAPNRIRKTQKTSFSVPKKKSPGARKRRGCLHNLI